MYLIDRMAEEADCISAHFGILSSHSPWCYNFLAGKFHPFVLPIFVFGFIISQPPWSRVGDLGRYSENGFQMIFEAYWSINRFILTHWMSRGFLIANVFPCFAKPFGPGTSCRFLCVMMSGSSLGSNQKCQRRKGDSLEGNSPKIHKPWKKIRL